MDHDNTFITATETAETTITTTAETVTRFTLDHTLSTSSSHLTGRASSTDTSTVRSPPQTRRQKSLVRPERERVDSHHRQYHYRQRATSSDPHTIAPSSTGNQPLRPSEDIEQQVHFAYDTSTISHRQSNSHEKTGAPRLVRRGKSVLGRKTSKRMGATGSGHQVVAEDDDDDDEENLPGGAIDLAKPLTFWEKLPDPWLTYCRLLTCCIPSAILSICGKFSG
jgi:chitin synthase